MKKLILLSIAIILWLSFSWIYGVDPLEELKVDNPPVVIVESHSGKVEKAKYNDGDKIVIQFSAVWCGPCQRLKQTMKDKAIQKLFDKNTKGYFIVDTDKKDENTRKWVEKAKPTTIPLVVLYVYKNGEWLETKRFVGAKTKDYVINWLKDV